MIALNISDEGYRIVELTPRTAKGRAASIDTKDRLPKMTTIDGDVVGEVTVLEDGKRLSVKLISGTVDDGTDFKVSTVQLDDADADMDPGEERTLSETFVVTVTRAEATSFDAALFPEQPKD